jgi:hypothetical protein
MTLIPNASLSTRLPKRDDFAQVMDELDFVKELIARIPTRRDQAFVP